MPPSGLGRFDGAVTRAWSASFLSSLDDAIADELLVDAREIVLGPGATFYRGAAHAQTEELGLVVDGLLRTFRTSVDGRQVTLRYAPPGRVIGLPAVMGFGTNIEAGAILASRVLALSASRFRALTQRHVALTLSVAVTLAEMVRETNDLLTAHLFLPMRSRVARHLLDMADVDGEQLVVRSSHQDIADAVGSVREVVSRTLKQLQAEGLVRREDRHLVLVDPPRLHRASVGAT